MPLYLEGRSGSVSGRRLTVTREKPFVIRTRTTNHEGEVQVRFDEGSYRLDNRSHMRCRLNGTEQKQAVLTNGDDLEIGKDRFAVVIEADTRPVVRTTPDEHDDHDTQSLSPVSVDAPVEGDSAIEPPVVCAVCDARIISGSSGKTWTDGERHICARCLAKGVKPDHLPRPFAQTVPKEITPSVGLPVLMDDQLVAAVEDSRTSSSSHILAGVPDPTSDSTAEVKPPAVSKDGMAPTSDSDRQRQSRRISASRLTAVEPAQREGLLTKVGKVFGRKDERHQRLADLEANRAALLAEAGRHALGTGGSLGLPEKAVQTLVSGGTITVSAADLSQADLERWRAQRQRMILLDAEIAALRKALGLGSDPQIHQQSSPTLRPDQKAMQDRAFATLDGLSTDELSRPELQPAQSEIAVKSSPSGRLKAPVPARRRR
ncbi:MAG TPA: hypothetical protein VHX44_09165 [Planctomycetota bacterium]|nr:hypothetical protein [Planctomycetota bacterium]